MVDYILSLYDKGGPVIAILAVLSVITLSTILNRLWVFSRYGAGRHTRVRNALQLWKQNKKLPAIQLLRSEKSPVGKTVFHAMQGLYHAPDQQDLVREDIDRVASDELAKARQGLRLLEMTSQIAPLLGLFGTILGMIEAFQALQAAGANIDPSALAGGIWVALMTTAAGLALAIPTSMIAGWFDALIDRETQSIESMVTSLLTGDITSIAIDQQKSPSLGSLDTEHAPS